MPDTYLNLMCNRFSTGQIGAVDGGVLAECAADDGIRSRRFAIVKRRQD